MTGMMILQCQGHAGIAGVACTLDQRIAAPAPDFLAGELLVDDRPESLGDVDSSPVADAA